jgi:hypothetical protein
MAINGPGAPSGYRQLTGPALAGERGAPQPVIGDHRKTARPLRRCWRRASRRLCSTKRHHHLGTRPAKPFCRGDETVLKQGAEYPLLVRLDDQNAIYLRSYLDAVVQQIPRRNGPAWGRAVIEASAVVLSVISLAIFAAHALDAYRTG